MTVIKLSSSNISSIKSQISATIVAAPNYFQHAPVVIDIHDVEEPANSLDLNAICGLLRDKKMIPVGVRGLEKSDHNVAISTGLAIMKAPKSKEKKPTPSLTSGSPGSSALKERIKPSSIKTKLVTTPVRAGAQLYARNSDLVIVAPVNAGAECFADGNIHVYGPLRGKALAGANGNEDARIFCESLEADLISIAGHYLTNENIKIPTNKKSMIQIYLKNQKLVIESI